MKRITLGLAVALLSAVAFAAAPTIETGSVSIGSHSNRTDLFTISYTLSGAPAVVTIDIQEKKDDVWTSLGGKGIGFLGGEANKVVYTLDKPSVAYWFPREGGDNRTASGTYRAVVKAWPTNAPPDYMVVNLTGAKNVVRWYATTNDFPGGFTDISYKTTKLVMRKIPAANVIWLMGSPRTLPGEGGAVTNNPAHKVMLTKDYYMAIYETTQKQHYLLGDTWNGYKWPQDDHPAGRLGYSHIRGDYTVAAWHWPVGRQVKADSPIDQLRTISGIADMDLPTSAQWEYAARAGSATHLPYNLEWTKANLMRFGVISDNKSKFGNHYAPVGSLEPNAWGLYDMWGNMQERVLDRMSTTTSATRDFLGSFVSTLASDWKTGGVTVDPEGPTDTCGNRAVICDGYWNQSWSSIMTDPLTASSSHANRSDGDPQWTDHSDSLDYIGYRVCCSVMEAVK